MSLAPETAMFKRFGALNARNLLYMQNELVFLEAKLKMAEAADAAAVKCSRSNFRRDFCCMLESEVAGLDTSQLMLVRRVRKLLKEYSEYQQEGPVSKVKLTDW